MRSTNLIAALSLTAALGLAATADAKTYCVGAPASCPADAAHVDFQAALSGAAANPGPDEIHVGAGTFKTTNGFTYATANDVNTVEIFGAGKEQTILRPDTDAKGTFTTLSVDSPGETTVHDLGIVAPARKAAGDKTRGARFAGDVTGEHVKVTEASGVLPATEGVLLDGGSLVDSRVQLSSGVAVEVEGNRSVIVNDCVLLAGIGVNNHLGGPVTVYRTRIAAWQRGVVNDRGADTRLASVVVRLTGGSSSALRVEAGGGHDATMLASQVTVEGYGHTATHAVSIEAADGNDAGMKLDNSILHGVTHGVTRYANHPDSYAGLQMRSVNYDSAGDGSTPPGGFSKHEITNLDPGFADVAAGDLRLVRSSPLLDKGYNLPTVPPPYYDAAGAPRTINGTTDLGAYEHQHAAPAAAIAPPAQVLVGQSLELNGAGSTGNDPGDQIASWAWAFGDGGTSVQGPQTTHVWAQPGTYEVALKVTDLDGKSAAAKRTVVVKALPAAPQSDPAPGDPASSDPAVGDPAVSDPAVDDSEAGGTPGGATPPAPPVTTAAGSAPATTPVAPADRTAPVISGLRRRGRAVGFSLSEPAAVRVRVERRKGRAFRAAGAVKRIAGVAGRNATRIGRLRPGRYRLVVTAVDAAGNRSVKRLAFRVGA
jgi:PKD domain-containing protein